MTLMDLFRQFGDPSKTYSDEVVATFYNEVDDGAFFGEALSEMPEAERSRIASLIDDRTSRTISHQMIGKIVTDQLRNYPRKYLQREYDKWNEGRAGDATGCMP